MERKPRSTSMSSSKTPSTDGDRSESSVRVLVVDDYEPFRRLVCSMLGKRPDFHVIGEAADGSEAVQKVEALKPDLIVLDIGLPTLNGIEAARRIHQLAPESKIIFLSQESSADVVQEALSLGALGYVVKTHAGTDLLTAVQTVIQGTQFVSRGLSVPNCVGATDKQIPDHLSRQEPLRSLEPEKSEIKRSSHAVQFYPDDASFLAGFTRFIEAALNAGNAVIVVATESHRTGLFERLQAQGLNVDAAIEQGNYTPLDVADTLSTFMVNDVPDPVLFRKVVGDLVATAAKAARGEHPRVAACGECAPTLWTQGKPDAAIQLERLCDEMPKTRGVDILCGYVLSSFQRERESDVYERICAEHSAVCSPERTVG